MGERRKETKKSTPKMMLPTGHPESLSNSAIGEIDYLEIKLILLVRQIVNQISIGSPVKVLWQAGKCTCSFKNFVLGKIPSNYEELLQKDIVYRAIVIELDTEMPYVKIKVYL